MTNQQEYRAADGPPDFLTVEEAAEILRIGRTAAYQLARRYQDTGGEDGLPVERFGRQLRVPRYRLEAMLGGPITWPLPSTKPTRIEPAPRATRVHRSRRKTRPEQASLPFDS